MDTREENLLLSLSIQYFTARNGSIHEDGEIEFVGESKSEVGGMDK